jgi:hypothetical protein
MVNTGTLAGVLAASGSKPVARYVPSYASPAATQRQEQINTAAGVNRTPTGRGAPTPPLDGNPNGVPTMASSQSSSAPAPRPPMRDTEWFNSDSLYRADRGGLATDLQDTLAQILYDRQNQYRSLDTTRQDWTQSRERDSMNLGENFAARGLGSSGLYKQGLDELSSEYEKSGGRIDQAEQQVTQEYGARNSMQSDQMKQDALFDQDYNALASIYGLLGSRGTTAGSRYGSNLNQARAQSAGRSGSNIINTLGW